MNNQMVQNQVLADKRTAEKRQKNLVERMDRVTQALNTPLRISNGKFVRLK